MFIRHMVPAPYSRMNLAFLCIQVLASIWALPLDELSTPSNPELTEMTITFVGNLNSTNGSSLEATEPTTLGDLEDRITGQENWTSDCCREESEVNGTVESISTEYTTESTKESEEVTEAGKEYNTTGLEDDNVILSTEDKIKVTNYKFPETISENTIDVKDVSYSLSPNESGKDSSNETQNSFKSFSDLYNSTELSIDVTTISDNQAWFEEEYFFFNTIVDIESLTTKSSNYDEKISSIADEHYKTYVDVTTTTAGSNDTESDEYETSKLDETTESMVKEELNYNITEKTRNIYEHTEPSTEYDLSFDVNTTDSMAQYNETIANFTTPSIIWMVGQREQNSTIQHNLTNFDLGSTETSLVHNSTTKPTLHEEADIFNCYVISGATIVSVTLIIVLCYVLVRRRQRNSIDISENSHLDMSIADFKLTPIPRITTISNFKRRDPILSRNYPLEETEVTSNNPRGYSQHSRVFGNGGLVNESYEYDSYDQIPMTRFNPPSNNKDRGHDDLAYIN